MERRKYGHDTPQIREGREGKCVDIVMGPGICFPAVEQIVGVKMSAIAIDLVILPFTNVVPTVWMCSLCIAVEVLYLCLPVR